MSEMLYSLSAIIFSSSFAIQLVRLIGRKDARSLAGFPSFSKGIMIAFLHIWGAMARLKDALKMASSSIFAIGPKVFKNIGGTSSGPAAPFLIFTDG